MDGDGVAGGGTPMFAIFVISLLSLFLIPYTIYRLCNADGEAVKPWETAESKKKGALARNLNRLLTPSSLALIAAWLVLFGLLFYVQKFAKEMAPFDPFDILRLDRSATEQDVKKAFKRLSLQYHPDKNSDPEAVPVYLKISQAYRALTDEEARKNWEKFGHPDGKQAVDMGIAIPLPTDGKNGPIILALLVFIGLVLPLGVAAWFLFSSSKFMGPNQIMQETLDIFYRSKFGVKESQSLARIPDTLVYAMEYIMLPTPPEQQGPLDALRKEILRSNPDLKEKPQWFKRKPAIVKVHMLLLAHMARRPIPAPLQKDLEFVLKKAPLLLEEMVKIAMLPHPTPCGWYGWLTPTIGAVELLQCLTQGVSIGSRKTFTHGKGGGESQAPMLQLPHMDTDVVKRLGRKGVRSITDLQQLGEEKMLEYLIAADLEEEEALEARRSVQSMPVVSIEDAQFLVEGEEGSAPVLEEDVVTLAVRLVLKRGYHQTQGVVSTRGSSVLAYAPLCPVPREEKWHIVLADASQNTAISWAPVSLKDAEDAGRAAAAAAEEAVQLGVKRARPALTGPGSNGVGGDDDEPPPLSNEVATGKAPGKAAVPQGKEVVAVKEDNGKKVGQLVELRFRAPRQGKYDLTLYVVSDSWVGCDKMLPMKLKVNELTRAEREGRTQRGKPVGEKTGQGTIEEGEANGNEAGSEDEEEDSEEDEDYDSEEGSTEESGSDSEAEDAFKGEKAETDSQASSSDNPPMLRDIEDKKTT